MPKNVDEITRALKLKAEPKANALTLRIGTKKYSLPFEVRTLNSEEFIFIHVPPAASIMKIENGSLTVVEKDADAVAAQASFRKPRKRKGGRGKTVAEIPAEVAELLKKIPAGFKIAYGADGAPKVVKARIRKK